MPTCPYCAARATSGRHQLCTACAGYNNCPSRVGRSPGPSAAARRAFPRKHGGARPGQVNNPLGHNGTRVRYCRSPLAERAVTATMTRAERAAIYAARAAAGLPIFRPGDAV